MYDSIFCLFWREFKLSGPGGMICKPRLFEVLDCVSYNSIDLFTPRKRHRSLSRAAAAVARSCKYESMAGVMVGRGERGLKPKRPKYTYWSVEGCCRRVVLLPDTAAVR